MTVPDRLPDTITGELAGLHERVSALERALGECHHTLHAVMEANHTAVFVKDRQGRFLMINSAGARMIGQPVEAVIGKDETAIFPADLAQRIMERDRQVMASGEAQSWEEIDDSGDTRRYYSTTRSPYRDNQGSILGVIDVYQDITKRKQSREILQKKERLLAEAQRVAMIGSWELDLRTNQVVWSDEHYRLFGLKPQGKPITPEVFREMIYPDDRTLVLLALQHAIRDQRSIDHDFRIRLPDGTPRTLHCRGEVILDDEDRPVRIVGTAQDITERKQAEEAQARLVAILEATPDLVGIGDLDSHPLYLNRAGRKLLGIGENDDISETFFSHFHPEWARKLIREEAIPIALREGMWSGETAFLSRSGQEIPTWQVILSHKSPTGSVEFRSTIARDLRERKKLEEQLLHSQKMEAIGRLAGGVAHDFNNLLTIITGYTDLLLDQLVPGNMPQQFLKEIKLAGERAASLIQQLLAFSRKQLLQPVVLDLNAVVVEAEKMLHRLIGEDIELVTRTDPTLGQVKADPQQIVQVIVNLAVNARDAMPKGGRLILQTQNADVERNGGNAEIPPGPYVLLSVADSGSGMDEATRARIFEPFFTTKEMGKGTGLGLAMAYGIIKQSGGNIEVHTELGHGTTFRIYLPRLPDVQQLQPEGTRSFAIPTGQETILLAEDEVGVRSLARHVLQSRGFKVLEASNGMEGLAVGERYSGPIHLLLTDVIMPLMSGPHLAKHLLAVRPEMKVLYISGYTAEEICRQGEFDPGTAFLQKPFTPDALTHKVHEVLEAIQKK